MEILGIDIPGQQRMIRSLGYGWQLGKQVPKVVVQIQTVEFGRLDDAVQVGTGIGTPGAATYHPVLPAHGKRSYCAFGEVVVRRQPGTVQVPDQPFPDFPGVGNRFAKG